MVRDVFLSPSLAPRHSFMLNRVDCICQSADNVIERSCTLSDEFGGKQMATALIASFAFTRFAARNLEVLWIFFVDPAPRWHVFDAAIDAA